MLDIIDVSHHCYQDMIFGVECTGTEPGSRIMKDT